MPKVLIIAATHGHEKIGLKVISELKKLKIDSKILKFIIGNPRAEKLNKSFIDTDLNRVFPGKVKGNYEEKRAFYLNKLIQESEIVIDIHSTNTTDLGKNSMLIVSKFDKATAKIISLISPPKLLFMDLNKGSFTISNAKIGIGFEYGEDGSEKVLAQTLYDIAKILIHFKILKNNPYKNSLKNKNTDKFKIYNTFKKEFNESYKLDINIKNFKRIKIGEKICITSSGKEILSDENFYPILFSENRYTEIFGFKSIKFK